MWVSMDGESKSFNRHGIQREITAKQRRRRRERGRGKEDDGSLVSKNQSFQSFLMVRHHSQERWSCLSSSVNLDLTL